MQRPEHLNNKARRAAGFSLVEILLSLGIFAIGMTAIVSLFPAAAILQRETTQEVISEMAAQSAASIIDAQKLTYEWTGTARAGDLANYYPNAGTNGTDAVPLNAISITGGTVLDRYPAADRSYPTGSLNGTSIIDCDMHWVPFIQDINGDPSGSQNWVMRLFIVEADSRATYTGNATLDANPNDVTTFPKVRYVGVSGVSGAVFTTASALDLDAGDTVMDSNGNSHVIVEVSGTSITVLNSISLTPNTPSKLWYAPKLGGSSSPAMRVVTVKVDVVAP